MKTAMYDNQEVTPSKHRQLAGSRWKELGRMASCKICGNTVHPNFVHSLNGNERFDHLDGVKDCPLSSKADPRYAALQPSDVDINAIERHRKVFFQTPLIHRCFDFCEYHIGIGKLSHTQFDGLIARADKLKVWGYRNLAFWTLPYIFLTLDDFVIEKADKSTFAIQFRFLKPVSGLIDDLWLKPSQCKLEKIFRDTGKLAAIPSGNPYELSEAYFWTAGVA